MVYSRRDSSCYVAPLTHKRLIKARPPLQQQCRSNRSQTQKLKFIPLHKQPVSQIITDPLNGPVLFCWLVSVVCRRRLSASVTLQAGRPATPSAWAVGWPGALAVGHPTLHGGPVELRPVRATPCLIRSNLIPRLSDAVRRTRY